MWWYLKTDWLKYKFPFRQIGKVKWFFHNLIWPKQKWVMRGVGRAWEDKPELLEKVMFNFIVDFVEGEKCFEVIDWEGDLSEKAIKDCYNWIKVCRPKLVDAIEQINPNLEQLESELKEKDTYYLKLIVEWRECLWT